MKKILFISSSGGHLAELLQLKSLFPLYRSFLITENDRMGKGVDVSGLENVFYFLPARRNNRFLFILNNIRNLALSVFYYLKLRPDVIVTTGANTAVYISLFAKLFGCKLIYIETMAAVTAKSVTGKILYPFADKFYIQWQSLKPLYPKAIYIGTIY